MENSSQNKFKHIPVLADEIIELMSPKHGEIFVDATLGFGGHAKRILEVIGDKGFLIGIDRDKEVITSC